MQPILNIAVNAARLAGDIIVRHIDRLERITITAKNGQEYVSDVDIKAEQAIINTILKAYPNHGIIAEESGQQNADAEIVWIIDPLDGTTNFLHSFPCYAVSIAVRVKNRIEHGVIYDPLRHECFSASRGYGSRLNEHRIRVSKQNKLSDALLGTGFPFRNEALAASYLPKLQTLVGKCAGIRRSGSAALDLAYVASGRLDGLWESGLREWDIAAGCLLVQEAGGLVSDINGGETYLTQGDIVAGNPKVFKSLLQALND